ncbi:MAG TPA: cobalt-precorrin 5A hydrolase [Desulfovibrio sp.]|uniref:cobalt-precorrin 5A hydrolase n=1 Tax=Desulfovibrio sp. TaxID=885 RepID=UPI002BF72A8E|nr:cobalt-precorrin 5A hydrolase [Desulfovibrio sp.]HMM37633.1 cobalt-precorrin 5A hydrolase [Desulfovibrio sp.]
MPESIAVYALTPGGLELARRLAPGLDAEVFAPARLTGPGERGFESLAACLAETFGRFSAHVFVAAAGLVVRLIAPRLRGKDRDPAVLVLDQEGRFCVSLLSGHLGGANALARRVAGLTGGQAVVTTATDSAGLPSLDLLAVERGLAIGNLSAVKRANALLLEGGVLDVEDPGRRLGDLDPAHFRRVDSGGRVRVDWRAAAGDEILVLHPRVLWAGMGCRRGTPAAEIRELLTRVFAEEGLAPASLAGIASVADKADEPGLLEAARELGVEARFFSREELSRVAVPTPSALVRKHMGLEGVCEAAAMLAADGPLVVPKRKTTRATLAVALAD